ncbi:MAG: hypothetical protein L3J16_03275 [Anaerolineales bacterium]|nr:hypothetical protein [Anaerolineales bacterium]
MKTTWEIDVFVNGPITVKGVVYLTEAKGFRIDDPFYSDIQIRSLGNAGVRATVTAFASSRELARKAALHFFAQTVDVLVLYTRLPLRLSLYENYSTRSSVRFNERRIVLRDEWRWAFREARMLAFSQPTFLRAIGWYRKGLIAEDPFDKFLAFWNSIEIVAGKYHPKNERSNKGSKSQIWECFKVLWSEHVDKWPIISGQTKWIDENYDIRKNIAHGVFTIDIQSIDDVAGQLNLLEMWIWMTLLL